MEKGDLQGVFSVGKNIVEIAKMELDVPIESCYALVFGQGELAKCILDIISPITQMAVQIEKESQLKHSSFTFDLIFLTEQLSPEILECHIATDGLAVDATNNNGEKWAILGGKSNFNRIRIAMIMNKN